MLRQFHITTILHHTFLLFQDACHFFMSQQVTYIKKLDAVTSVNSHEIVNLFDILKDVLIKFVDKFKQITSDIL